LSAIFNHAVRYYELKSNPAAKAGNMGKAQTKEIEFWTKYVEKDIQPPLVLPNL